MHSHIPADMSRRYAFPHPRRASLVPAPSGGVPCAAVFGGMAVDASLAPVVFGDLWAVDLPPEDAPGDGGGGGDLVDEGGGGGGGDGGMHMPMGGEDGDDMGLMVVGRRMAIEEIRDYEDGDVGDDGVGDDGGMHFPAGGDGADEDGGKDGGGSGK